MMRRAIVSIFVIAFLAIAQAGCGRRAHNQLLVYCAVDEPYASEIFADFQKETGIVIIPQYDIESSKSVGLAGKLEAEASHPRADVWWGSEAFLSVRLANEGVLQPYVSSNAIDIDPQYKEASGLWTGVGLRARVLAVSIKNPPPFSPTSILDLADPRLKGKVTLSRPTAGATGAMLAALYATWGAEKAEAFCRRLHENGLNLVGGNAEVAGAVGVGQFSLGITDSDDCANTISDGGKLTMVVPDQGDTQQGTLAMPTTVGLVKGSGNEENAKKLIDYLVSKKCEQHLIDKKFARWSVRGGEGIPLKAMKVDYVAAARIYAQAQREATALLEGREP